MNYQLQQTDNTFTRFIFRSICLIWNGRKFGEEKIIGRIEAAGNRWKAIPEDPADAPEVFFSISTAQKFLKNPYKFRLKHI